MHTNFNDAVGSTGMILTLIGQATGIIGTQLFAFSLIISGRVHFIEKLFGGLDKLYSIHHRTGVFAFTLLAIHPMILAGRFASTSLESVASFLSPIGNTDAITYGIIGILIMLVLLFITFYGTIFNYPGLKLAHQFLGLGFFFGALHVYFIPSSLSTDSVLKYSLLGTAFIGAIMFIYRTLLGKFLVPRYHYVISSVQDLGGGMVEVNLKGATDKVMYHLPGQFGMLSFPHSSAVSDEEHPFTISSPGLDGTLRFSIKALGDYTKMLTGLKEGGKALVEGPYGEFSYLYGIERQVWVAGGIGVTPFVSFAEHILKRDTLPFTIDFFYSARSDADGVYKELFAKLANKFPSFTFHFMPSDTKGYLSGEVLLAQIKDLHKRNLFMCGPPGLMTALSGQLAVLKVPESNIHSERFDMLK
jgi:predicted ferric reductase